jgi:hypothetical protein
VSAQNFLDELAMDIREPIVAALESIRQALMVNAEQMEHRGVQIVDMDEPFGHGEA